MYSISATILILGLKNTGKKTFQTVLVNKFVSILPRNFRAFLKNNSIHTIDVHPNFSLKNVENKIGKDTKLIIYMVDGSNEKSFVHAKQEFLNLFNLIKNKSVPLLILVNKVDLEISPNLITQIIEDFELTEIVDYKWMIHKISAKTGEGLENCLQWVYETITGSAFPSPLFIRDLFVFRADGVLLGKMKNGSIKDPCLHSGLLAALEILAQENLNGSLDILASGSQKIVFSRRRDLIGVIIINGETAIAMAKHLLEQVLTKIEKRKT
ncbi:MAG: ADP-ribosylation factor-like protein, partial [Candidatus Hodarchaeota archaeon]